MAKQIINIGTSANKGDGEPIKNVLDKINDNFDELYPRVGNSETGTVTTGDVKVCSCLVMIPTLLVDGVNSKIPSKFIRGAIARNRFSIDRNHQSALGGQNASYYPDYNNFTNIQQYLQVHLQT